MYNGGILEIKEEMERQPEYEQHPANNGRLCRLSNRIDIKRFEFLKENI